MRLLVVFLISLVVSQSISIGVGLLVERNTTPYTGLVTFIALYFAMFWVSLAVCDPHNRTKRAFRQPVEQRGKSSALRHGISKRR